MGFFDNNKPTAEQELYMLKGRVEATIAAIKAEAYIDRETILVMLGGKPNVKVPITELVIDEDVLREVRAYSDNTVEPETTTNTELGTKTGSGNW